MSKQAIGNTHNTPRHSDWLNVIKIELGACHHSAFDKRFRDMTELATKTAARNLVNRKIHKELVIIKFIKSNIGSTVFKQIAFPNISTICNSYSVAEILSD